MGTTGQIELHDIIIEYHIYFEVSFYDFAISLVT